MDCLNLPRGSLNSSELQHLQCVCACVRVSVRARVFSRVNKKASLYLNTFPFTSNIHDPITAGTGAFLLPLLPRLPFSSQLFITGQPRLGAPQEQFPWLDSFTSHLLIPPTLLSKKKKRDLADSPEPKRVLFINKCTEVHHGLMTFQSNGAVKDSFLYLPPSSHPSLFWKH